MILVMEPVAFTNHIGFKFKGFYMFRKCNLWKTGNQTRTRQKNGILLLVSLKTGTEKEIVTK